MATPLIIAHCQNPWLFWWSLLPIEERKVLKQKYFSTSHPNFAGALLDHQKQAVWEAEKPEPLREADWIDLATILINSSRPVFTPKEQREIWRQVYRIASEYVQI